MIRIIKPNEILNSALLKEYADECAIPLLGEINPSRLLYAAMDEAGILTCFGAYDGDKMIGFATVVTTIYPHYSKKVATIESLFMASESRCGGMSGALMVAVEETVKASGCIAILYSAPVGSQLEKLLDGKKSYARTSTIFGKSLA